MASSSLITRVNGRRRAMRAWIDRTNDGQSGMPADGISMPTKKGTSACPAGPARRLGYINHATGGRGHDRLWPTAAQNDVRSNVGYWVLSGLGVLTLSLAARDPERTSRHWQAESIKRLNLRLVDPSLSSLAIS